MGADCLIIYFYKRRKNTSVHQMTIVANGGELINGQFKVCLVL